MESLGNSPNVYFQPPNSYKLAYPCIVYSRDQTRILYADNSSYTVYRRYQMTIIDPNPDSPIIDAIEDMPLTSFQRHLATANLNHDIYSLYF